jgi:hypothetical protein
MAAQIQCVAGSRKAVAEPSRTTQLFAAVIAVAVGALVGVMIYRYPEGLHAPAWVGYMAASSFVFAGFCLFAAAADVPWLQRWLGLAVALSLLSVSAWVAFGPGERECSFSLSFMSGFASEAMCRGGFATGAILVGLLVVLAVRHAATRDR